MGTGDVETGPENELATRSRPVRLTLTTNSFKKRKKKITCDSRTLVLV